MSFDANPSRIPFRRVLALGLLAAACAMPAAQARMYKWVDDDGKVHYSDKVPPEHIRRPHDRFNEEGVKVESTGAAKTAEELAKEREIERLRKEQERLARQQEAEDRVLLRTFRSEDDLLMARDGKLSALDVHIKIARGSITRLKERLQEMQGNAAELERAGKGVSKRYQENMDATRRQIEESYDSILQKERQKEDIRQQFATDLERFRQLKNIDAEQDPAKQEQATLSTLDNVYQCTDDADCARAWERAQAYVRQHGTTGIQLSGDNIVMGKAPRQDTDISLTVSRIPGKEGAAPSLFLDMQCRNTPIGEETCNGTKGQSIRKEFRTRMAGD